MEAVLRTVRFLQELHTVAFQPPRLQGKRLLLPERLVELCKIPGNDDLVFLAFKREEAAVKIKHFIKKTQKSVGLFRFNHLKIPFLPRALLAEDFRQLFRADGISSRSDAVPQPVERHLVRRAFQLLHHVFFLIF